MHALLFVQGLQSSDDPFMFLVELGHLLDVLVGVEDQNRRQLVPKLALH